MTDATILRSLRDEQRAALQVWLDCRARADAEHTEANAAWAAEGAPELPAASRERVLKALVWLRYCEEQERKTAAILRNLEYELGGVTAANE